MAKDAILGFIRHVLTFGGGFLASAGYATDADIQTAAAAIITIAGFVWSVIDKKKAK